MNPRSTLWAVRRLTLERGLRERSAAWRASGGPVVAAYALVVLPVLALGGLQELRQVQLAVPGWSLALLALALNAWALAGRRHPLALHRTDLLLLERPHPPGQTLLWLLFRSMGLPFVAGLGGAALVSGCTPLGAQALVIPLAALGGVPLAALARDARWNGSRRGQRAALALGLTPALGLLHPALLALAALGVLGLSLRLWARGWAHGPNPRAVRDMGFTGLLQTAARLQIPPPTSHPETRRPRPRWRPGLRGRGAFPAARWRSVLHLSRHAWRLAAAALLGAALPLLPTGPLTADPLAGAAPMLLAGLLSACLPLLGPALPGWLPIGRATGRLARLLPAALALGGLAGAAALLCTVLMGRVPTGGAGWPVLAAGLLPWASLSLAGWAGADGWLPQGQATQIRLGLAFAPVLVAVLALQTPLPGLVVPVLLAFGLPTLWAWWHERGRDAQQSGLTPARQP